MNIVIAMDSFKGSMTSMEAGCAVKEGILRACDADIAVFPVADGGEGTVNALVEGLSGVYAQCVVTGPMGKATTAVYGILNGGNTAVMEMAEAAGILLVDKNDLDPWRASTTGVGEMILDALSRGCREFLIGIGGSATTEGGIGMLQALGYAFYDADGKRLPPVFDSLGKIETIAAEQVPEALPNCRFRIACDVANPLCGENGAVFVYGPQKGVRQKERQKMDDAMQHYAKKTAAFCGTDNSLMSGAGAAGGMGFAFVSFLPHAVLQSGISMVLEAAGLKHKLRDADFVVTGEGRLDAQTAMGKAPVGVARLAKQYGCKVIAFAGSVTNDAGNCNAAGIDAFFSIARNAATLEEAMRTETAKKNLSLAAEQVFRLLL